MNETPWLDGQTDRYLPCARHADALSRMDYDTAWSVAYRCTVCVTEVRPS